MKQDKIQECYDIAERNGLLWEVRNQATIDMARGESELQSVINALVDWDLI